MDLRKSWKTYEEESIVNYSILPDQLIRQGREIIFPAQSTLVLRGEFPRYIYFIKEGSVLGQRINRDGNEYNYFRLDESNGNVGLLEIFARKEEYVATIVCLTEVKTLRIDSALFYGYVMNDVSLLRRCLSLVAEDLYHRSGNDGIFYYMEGIDRVRAYLMNYYNDKTKHGKDVIEVDAEYHDIAEAVGLSIRTVGRSLKRLRESNEISSFKKRMSISRAQYELIVEKLRGI